MSSLLFILCIEGLLMKMGALLRSPETAAGYADDVAVAVMDLNLRLPQLARMFDSLGKAAALHLNIKKTVLIPLCTGEKRDGIRDLVEIAVPQWKTCASRTAAISWVLNLDPSP